MTRGVEWAKLTAPEIRAVAAKPDAFVLLPVGSLEQHGPHLPTITDTASAAAVAIRAAELVAGNPPVLVLPGLWTGMSEHHLPFGGTVSLNLAEFCGVLRGVVRSLRAVGFRRLLIVNGHGGNIDPLSVATRELAHEFAMPVVACTPWFLAAEKVAAILETAKGALHACEGETSLMLAIAPDTVRADRLDEAVRQAPPPVAARPGFARFWSFSERAPATGTWGDPRPSTPEKGTRFLDALAQAVVEAMRDPALWSKPDDVWAENRGQGTTAGAVPRG